METKSFMVNLYDLLAKNDIYNPRESLDDTLDNLKDYHLNVDDNGNATILFYDAEGSEYVLSINKTYQGESHE